MAQARPSKAMMVPIARDQVKEISPFALLLRLGGRVAAVSGVVALLIWITWVMLDIKNLQSGFTLP